MLPHLIFPHISRLKFKRFLKYKISIKYMLNPKFLGNFLLKFGKLFYDCTKFGKDIFGHI